MGRSIWHPKISRIFSPVTPRIIDGDAVVIRCIQDVPIPLPKPMTAQPFEMAYLEYQKSVARAACRQSLSSEAAKAVSENLIAAVRPSVAPSFLLPGSLPA